MLHEHLDCHTPIAAAELVRRSVLLHFVGMLPLPRLSLLSVPCSLARSTEADSWREAQEALATRLTGHVHLVSFVVG